MDQEILENIQEKFDALEGALNAIEFMVEIVAAQNFAKYSKEEAKVSLETVSSHARHKLTVKANSPEEQLDIKARIGPHFVERVEKLVAKVSSRADDLRRHTGA